MSDATRYLCIALLRGTERVFLWEDEDGGTSRVIVDDQGFVVSFASVAEAVAAGHVNGWNISSEDATTYDIDAFEQWARSDAPVGDCRPLLNVWNLLIDLPGAENLFRAADARALGVYDKLFRGCNLPAMTRPGEEYQPLWTTSETSALKQLLLLGIAELRARFR
jgi:hypothetical protein